MEQVDLQGPSDVVGAVAVRRVGAPADGVLHDPDPGRSAHRGGPG